MKRNLLLSLACLTAVATAQQAPHTTGASAKSTASIPDGIAKFRAPIHTQVADPIGGEYGTWASGDTYKVSFHDGMTFYPAVEVEGQVRWQTTSVRVGDMELLNGGQAEHSYSDWRYEYRYGQVTEAYDVRVEGVEQTFVLSTIPGAGDLVVTGRVDSALSIEPMSAEHGGVSFKDADGREIVEYGAATVIDAAGRRLQITTAVHGNEIELRVPAGWLETATAPVTIDPLLSRSVVRLSSGNTIRIDLARDDESNQLLVSYVRWSGNESDLFVVLCNDDFTGSTLVYSDVTSSWEALDPSVGYVGGANKWLMTWTRKFSSSSYGTRYHYHPKGMMAAQVGYKALSGPGGTSTVRSEVGGAASYTLNSKALVVFEADTFVSSQGSDATDVWGAIFDAANETVGQPFLLSSVGSSQATSRDRGYPTVTKESDGATPSWVVAWTEYNLAINNDDWDIHVARIKDTGVKSSPYGAGISAASHHALRPVVSGGEGRYLVAFGDAANSGKASPGAGAPNIYAQRINWPDSQQIPWRGMARAVRTANGVTYFTGDVAYDNENRSHWVVVSHGMSPNQVVWADVIGHAGGIVESLQVSQAVANSDFSPAVIYNDDTDNFAIAHGSLDKKVYGRMLTRNLAQASTYGISCGPGSISRTGLPQSGSEFFTLNLTGVAPNSNAFLSLALAPAAINLNFIGMTGCFANTDPNLFLTTIPIVTGMAQGEVQLPMPAPISADIYTQFIYMNLGANALGVQATKGMKLEIR